MGKVFTVSQINQYLRGLIRSDVLSRGLTVSGEVSNCTDHGSGHLYFTLKDAGSTLSCVMFSSDRGGLSFRLEEGQKVRVSGRLDVYPQGGRYQLYAYGIEQDGAGELYQRFLKCKEKLEEEGLFDAAYKRPIPPYIRTLGIVTAPAGAAVRDMIQISRRRNPYVQIVLFPALVQGEHAPESIIKGIRALERYGVDVIIAGRGGGAIEDLQAFNEESVARAIFDSAVPVISAVGHETDVTIADFAADLRAPTPSAAAELAVFEYHRFAESVRTYRADLVAEMTDRLSGARERLMAQQKNLRYLSPGARVRDLKLCADEYRERIGTNMRRIVSAQRNRLSGMREDLSDAMLKLLTVRKNQLSLMTERLKGRSPMERLKNGYGYVTDENGRRVTQVSGVGQGELLHIYFADGKIDATVERVTEGSF